MVLGSDGNNSRWFTCAQVDAMDPGQTVWTFTTRNCAAEYLKKQRSPHASYDADNAIFTYVSRRVIKVLVDSPGGGAIIPGKILLQSIVVEPTAGERFISVGTAFEGTDIVDNEVIRSNTPWEYTSVRYFEDTTLYITTASAMVVWIAFDLLTEQPSN